MTQVQEVPRSAAGVGAAAHQAFWLLRIGFTVAPILFGLGLLLGALALGRLALAIDATRRSG
jgi:hypothetical protein